MDHVLSGTDMPLGGPKVIPDTLGDIRALQLPPDAEHRILPGNAERLLGPAVSAGRIGHPGSGETVTLRLAML